MSANLIPKRSALDSIFKICEKIQLVHLSFLLPLIFFKPGVMFTLMLLVSSFLFGLLFQEAITPVSGGYGLVENHYKVLIMERYQEKELQKPKTEHMDLEIPPELQNALNRLISFIVRDFINGMWYTNLNHSGSDEFPAAVAESMQFAFRKIGQSASNINPTDLILAVMRKAICHIKEYRSFDMANIDLKDYLEQKKSSIFNRFYTRKDVINHLRDISMKLCLFALPRSDKNSSAVFGLVREILATTVLMPTIEKLSAPDFINQHLLVLLKLEVEERSETTKNAHQDQVEALIISKKGKIHNLDEQLKKIASSDNFSDVLEDKMKCQSELEDLQEILLDTKENPSGDLLDISKCVILVEEKVNKSRDLFSGLIGVPEMFTVVVTSENALWAIDKEGKDFQELQQLIHGNLPRVNQEIPCNGPTASDYSIWLTQLVKDSVAGVWLPLIRFLQPPKSSNEIENPVSTHEFIPISKDDTPANSTINSTTISLADLDIILDVTFTAIEELFSILEDQQWLAQQSLHLIKVVLKRTFSVRLSNLVAEKVDAVSSGPAATKTLNSFSDALWPQGRIWGSEPPLQRSPQEIDRTKHLLFCLMTGTEGVKKSAEFENVFGHFQTILGSQNANKGLLRGFHLFQNETLTIGLFCEILETVVDLISSS